MIVQLPILLLVLVLTKRLDFFDVAGGLHVLEKHADAVEDESSDRVGWISHAIEKQDLKPGDHIYAYRTVFAYSHHGIYVGEEDCEVIHFAGRDDCSSKRAKDGAIIQKSTLADFSQGSEIRLVAYDVPWLTALIKSGPSVKRYKSDPPEEVIARAKEYASHPDMWGNYNVVLNNCETFAVYCKTGIPRNLATQGNLFRNQIDT